MLQISLKAARVNAGLKQKDAAKAIGVDASTIISWEKGNTSPRFDQLKKLSEIYAIPIDSIFLHK